MSKQPATAVSTTPDSSLWSVRENHTGNVELCDLLFSGEEQLGRITPESLSLLPSQFRVVDQRGIPLIIGHAERVTREPLWWAIARWGCKSAYCIEYRGLGAQADNWVRVAYSEDPR